MLETWRDWASSVKAQIGADFADWPFDRVTVVVCCKNKNRELHRTIPALCRQIRAPDKIVFADDHSDDGSVETFRALVAPTGIAHEVVRPSARGPFQLNTLRNLGVERSLDGLVVIVDADLIVGPSFVDAHLSLHLKEAGPASSLGPLFEAATAEGDGPINFMWGHEPWAHQSHPDSRRVPTWATVLGGNLGIHRRLWLAAGGFDAAYNGWYGVDDQDFHYRLHLLGVRHVGDFGAHCIHIPHETALGARDGTRNLKVFAEKYGIDVYATRNIARPIHWLGCRGVPWHKRYSKLKRGEIDGANTNGAHEQYTQGTDGLKRRVEALDRELRAAAAERDRALEELRHYKQSEVASAALWAARTVERFAPTAVKVGRGTARAVSALVEALKSARLTPEERHR